MIGNRILFLHEVDSTNNYAAKLLSEGKLAHGTVILAEKQTAGRGQRGNSWSSRSGKQFTASIYLDTAFLSVDRLVVFNMMVALALRKAISGYFEKETLIKWPNDILVYNKKISGILIESQVKNGTVTGAICGVGINLFSELSLPSSISFSELLSTVPEPLSVSERLCAALNEYYLRLKNGDDEKLKAEYLTFLWNYARPVSAELADGTPIEGQIVGVNKNGDLEFQTSTELVSFGIKEIKFQY